MVTKFWSLAGLTASLLAGTAIAQTTSPASDGWMDSFDTGGQWYLGAKVGGNWAAHDTRLRSNSFGSPIAGSAQYDDGYIGAIQGGYAFNNGLSLEVEGAMRYNAVDNIRGYTGTSRGSMRNYAVMGNVLYDLPLAAMGIDLPFTPYIGAGLGMADSAPYHIRSDGMPYPAYIGGPDKWGLAYQAIAGVRYPLTENIDLSLEYRFFSRTDENYPRGVANDYDAHSALIGVRYKFGEPAHVEQVQQAAYVAPPAAPATPRNYLVFFDFNKSDLTSDARGIVDTAAVNAQNNHVTQLEVTGYTDTVGSDAYNMRLSRRRAESVSAELQAKGIPASEIAIYAKGKHDLLVPTADGVREPQNRRVQIVYSAGGGTGPNS
jgi:outer membrane protein OmpA-like peptidoglycan-associated protein